MPKPAPVSIEFTLINGVAKQVMWLAFVVFHLALAVLSLALLWWYQIPPSQLAGFLVSVPASLTVQWIALLGLTGASILALYVKWWKKRFWRVSSNALFRPLYEAAKSTD